MAVFYNSSAQIQTASVTNLTMNSLSLTTTISGTVQNAITGAIVVTANSTDGANLQSRLIFSNSNSVTFGAARVANNVVITASTAGAIVVSASNTQATLSTLVFSNTNNFIFEASTNTASTGNLTIWARTTGPTTYSYFNYPVGPFLGSTFVNINGTIGTRNTRTNIVQPFNLPYPVSFNCLRLPVFQNAMVASTQNSSFTETELRTTRGGFLQTANLYANIYSLDRGANSNLLALVTAFSFASTMLWRYTYTNSTQVSYTYEMSFGRDNTTTNTSYSYSSATAAIIVSTGQLTNVTGNRFVDIVVTNGTSLSAGAYWLMLQISHSTSNESAWTLVGTNTSSNPFASGVLTYSNFVNTQYASGFALMNAASTHLKLGAGSWNLVTTDVSPVTIALSNIVTNASNIEVPFELMNRV